MYCIHQHAGEYNKDKKTRATLEKLKLHTKNYVVIKRLMRIEIGDQFKPQTIKKSPMLKKGKFYCLAEVEKELR